VNSIAIAIEALSRAVRPIADKPCRCRSCIEARPHEPWLYLFGRVQIMVLCSTCGNKRCPHAAHHDNTCTGSNEPGQPGSDYP
jgi:flavoprotein